MRDMTWIIILLLATLTGCFRVRTEPIEIKPIHITIDVNLKMDRALQDFFGEIDATDPTLQPSK